ncbi:MAG: hypothetical protein ACYCW6_28640 [Candidatus Xenobia bacterium]
MKQVYRFLPRAPLQAWLLGSGLLLLALTCLVALLAVVQYGVFNTQGAARLFCLIVGPLVLGLIFLFTVRSGMTAVMRGRWLSRTYLEVDEAGITISADATLELYDWDRVRLVWLSGKLKAVQIAGAMLWVGEVEDSEGFARTVGTFKEKGT